jgi:hypothetical protein
MTEPADVRRREEHLVALERELHLLATRRNAHRMDELLHPDFVELASSGRPYSRSEVIEEFAGGAMLPAVVASDFSVTELARGVALLTYRSAHLHPDGELHRHTLRSSLWLETPTGWRLRLHQGTPIAGLP